MRRVRVTYNNDIFQIIINMFIVCIVYISTTYNKTGPTRVSNSTAFHI